MNSKIKKATTHISQNEGLIFEKSSPGTKAYKLPPLDVPEIDPAHIVMSGVSFGGIQTLLAAEKGLGVRAFVAFAPGAMSWRHVPALRARLEQAVGKAQAPVLIIQARNDFDLAPSEVLGPALERAAKGRAVVFPAFGATERDGHGAFARSREGTAIWGATVLDFLRTASR